MADKELSEVEKAMQDPVRAKRINDEYTEIARLELEIRAAKALGLETDTTILYGTEYTYYKTPFVRLCLPEGMKFTTSYDWAMLGVKECVKRGPNLSNKVHDKLKLLVYNDCILELDPEQITQAWVEVLESTK